MKIFSTPSADSEPAVNVSTGTTLAAAQATDRPPENRPSLIGSDLKVIGTIIAETNLHIDGRVEGQIQAVNLTIGQGAVVEAEIIAEDIVVSGKVIGAIRADKIRFTGTAEVEGELIHRVFAIDSGAHFQGTVHHTPDPLERASTSDTGFGGQTESASPSTYGVATEESDEELDTNDAGDEEKDTGWN